MAVPSEMPAFGSQFTRWLGTFLLDLFGWKIVGEFPPEKKMLIAVAPHTSNWDFVLAMLGVMALGVKISFLMKKEAFFWPLRNVFIYLGGIPLDRGAADDTVAQIARWYRDNEKVCVAITPEGTRGKVKKWKTGFLRIAHMSKAVLFIVAWNYPSKTIVLDRTWPVSDDFAGEAEEIRAYINSRFIGRHQENQ